MTSEVAVDRPPIRTLRPSRRWAAALALVVLAALGIRLAALAWTAPDVPVFGDARAYHLLARGLADGEGYVRPYDLEREGRRVPTAEYPPGLPVLLAGADLLGVGSEDGQRALLAVVGGLTVALIGVGGRRLGGDGVGIAAAAVAAVHPSLWSADTSLAPESLASFFGALSIVVALAVHDRPVARRWALLGATLGLGALCRSEALVLVPLLVLPLAWTVHPDLRSRLRAAGLAVAVAVAVLAPWTVRNALTFHRFVPVSNNLGSVVRGANCDLTYHGEFLGLWVTNVADVGGDLVDPDGACFTGFPIRPGVNEAEAAGEIRAEGTRYALDHAGAVPRVVAARLARTAGLYRFDQQTGFAGLEGRNVTWERRGTRVFQGLALLAVLGLVAPWRRRRPTLVLVAPVLATIAVVVVTYGNLRFRAFGEPAVVILAVLAIADLVVRFGPGGLAASGADGPASGSEAPGGA